MSQHTPGPWRQGKKHPARIIGADDAIVALAVAREDDETTPNEIELANARLIAKAPELLNLIRDWTRWQEAVMGGRPSQLLQRAETLLKEIEGTGGPSC